MSEEVARCYQCLHLAADASLQEVEAAYFSRRAELIQTGQRQALADLKIAYRRLKEHLQTSQGPPAISSSGEEDPLAPLIYQLRQQGVPARVALRHGHLHIGVPLKQMPSQAKGVASIRAALVRLDPEALGLEPGLTIRIYGLKAPKRVAWKQTISWPSTRLTDTDLFAFDNRFSNGLIFPGLLLLGMLMQVLPPVKLLLFGVQVWMHEFGHATVAWLAGRRAIPLPFGWTNVEPERSLFVYLGLLVLFGLLFWAGRREGHRWPMVLAVGLILIQGWMTWMLSAQTFEVLLAFGGVGGELYLSTLLMVSFFFPMPAYWRWDFYRYPVVLGSAFVFLGGFGLWHRIERGLASIPWGSLWGGPEHAGGDMNILRLHGWSDQQIIGTYRALGDGCLLVLMGVYLYVLLKQHPQWWARLWQGGRRRHS
ncbi:hypothetical protein XM38_006290 [Halomicronema hongdechloris C2206]|uniref:Uncharacterized protein n=1 Tax=Halomicronema hongdechloris C2206 TaxID=1641165 RepID=A0A1Z3HHF1_9CYAN|nr:hypothetical protein [Halomicronema hongdechloris]ASC69700.1 hypothetical protein XM38_006290 [Halomicronema hongdechloris C2206]